MDHMYPVISTAVFCYQPNRLVGNRTASALGMSTNTAAYLLEGGLPLLGKYIDIFFLLLYENSSVAFSCPALV